MLTVKILGPRCPNCRRLEAETRAALDAAQPGIAYEIVKVTDYMDIVSYGVMSTPALMMALGMSRPGFCISSLAPDINSNPMKL